MSAGDPPTGVVTFLFTDIEGSTRRWESDADAMRSALAVHDKVLRSAIEAHEGFVFSHSGDGLAAAFSSPMSAVDAAITAQRELQLPVRMGIATGEAELRDGDYFGTVLNRAARVMAAGHGGQILVADSTAGLLGGVELMSMGLRRLRDVPNPITLFQLRSKGLRSQFPPLLTLDSDQGNFRPATTRLVGREDEVTATSNALLSTRLVTLAGVGGVGKTRLALEVAAQLTRQFPDGIWIFELAAVTDPAAVPDAVATALGIAQQPGKSVSESVACAQEGRVRLLVFDNCEHVVDAAADLIDLILAQSDCVKILVTSREGLGLAEERIRRVPSLEVAAAVQLFAQRAQAMGTDELHAVEEVCRRLDGIPLAIELAASRMESMTATELRDRLDRRFKLLIGSRRGLERHQTLRHAVAWSYDLLNEAEKGILDRCSVFVGGFDLQSACAVVGSEDTDDFAVLDVLDALVRKSLLIADRSSGQTRFAMLETIRQFAEEQLVVRGDATEARAAHARYFAGRMDDVLALWDSPQQRDAYRWFTVETANLRAAFRCATDSGDLDTAVAIATYGAFLGGIWLGIYEPIAWVEELIEPARAIDHPRLAFLYVMASLCWQPGRIEDGLRYSEAGQALLNSGGGEVPFGVGGFLGGVHLAAGQPDKCVEIARAHVPDDADSLANATYVLALAAAGLHDEAIAGAIALTRATEGSGNPCVLTMGLLAYGYALWEAEPDRALEALRRGLAVAQDSGNRSNQSHLAMSLFRLEAEYGEPLAALDYCATAVRNYHDAGNTSQLRAVSALLVAFLDRLGHHQPAAVIAGFAVSALTTATISELGAATTHLRTVLCDALYERLAREGADMTTAAMVAYVYDQIDEVRTELAVQQ